MVDYFNTISFWKSLLTFTDSEPVLEPARARAVSEGFRFAALFVYSPFFKVGIVFFLPGNWVDYFFNPGPAVAGLLSFEFIMIMLSSQLS